MLADCVVTQYSSTLTEWMGSSVVYKQTFRIRLHPSLASSGPADSDQIETNKQDSILWRPFSSLNVENVRAQHCPLPVLLEIVLGATWHEVVWKIYLQQNFRHSLKKCILFCQLRNIIIILKRSHPCILIYIEIFRFLRLAVGLRAHHLRWRTH